ncbi:Na/Pi cotransporter, partial [Leisingera sp. ANG-M1]|uniref:Na/Pi cotransporter family protein n=1 Tax=Leisingera sp. ANG-M1 TaxID=1577895 RepID=UPI00057CF428
LALPFCGRLQGLFERLVPVAKAPEPGLPHGRPSSALDLARIGRPSQARANLKRELLRMSDLVETMFQPALELYRSGSKEDIKAVQATDAEVNACLSGIRQYVTALPADEFGKENTAEMQSLLEYAIRLETAGDVVAKRLTALASEMRKKSTDFSKDGWAELVEMHESILANLKLSKNVLISDDLESARLLSQEKSEIKRAERDSRKRHLRRLQHGTAGSFETSDIHLETLRALREFNSHIAAVASPILYRHGQLLETRLIEAMPKMTNTALTEAKT